MSLPLARPATYLCAAWLLSATAPASAEIEALASQAAPKMQVEQRRLREPLSFRQLGPSDGLRLPQSSATAITQDEVGFIWIGTQDGLVRFDGYRTIVHRPRRNNDASLLGAYITALAVHPNGQLWVGTDEGLSVYDSATESFVRLTHDPNDPRTMSPGGINAIFVETDSIWVAPIQGGLARINPSTREVDHFVEPPLGGVTVTSIARDHSGKLWLGTAETLLVFDPRDGSGKHYTTDRSKGASGLKVEVISTMVDSAGRVWVGTRGSGLLLIEEGVLRRYRNDPGDHDSLSDDRVTSIMEDQAGRVWVGTLNGLNRFEPERQTFSHSKPERRSGSLPGLEVLTLFEDRGGVIWVGMDAAGVALFDNLRLKFRYHSTDVPPLSFAVGPDKALWVGTNGEGLLKVERAKKKETLYRGLGKPGAANYVDLEGTLIWSLLLTPEGILWLGTDNQGLVRFDPVTNEAKKYATPWIWDNWQEPSGVHWQATRGGGILVLDPQGESVTSYTTETLSGMTSDYLYRLYPDPLDDDVLWLGTAEGGLCHLERSKLDLQCFQHDPEQQGGLSGNSISAIYRDTAGILWVGTYGQGLDRLDPVSGEVETLDSDNSELNDNIYGILADDEEKLWVSTSSGLFHVDRESSHIIRYGEHDGLQGDEFVLGAAYRAPEGELFFGGIRGFSAFDPIEIVPDDYVPPLLISGFRSFNEDIELEAPIWMLETLRVSYRTSFELEFAALAFAAPEGNRFAYQLEGINSGWIEGRRTASFGNLPGGLYHLRVKAANRHGVWNEKEVVLPIRVRPPPWKTWWAYTLYGIFVIGSLGGYRNYHLQKLRRVEQLNRLEAVERELELSGAVQRGFFPRSNQVNSDRFRLCGFYRAADSCSGDWWWYEDKGGGEHAMLVGDVTGHGAGPAMVTAAVATAFRVQAGAYKPTIPQALDILNHEVLVVGQGKYHMTLCAVEVNDNDGSFRIFSAGAPPILRVQGQGRARPIICRGTPLGTAEFEAGMVEGQLQPGERLFLYTDGIPEIELPDGKLLGMRRFSKLLEQSRQFELQQAIEWLVTEADGLRQQSPQDDDWTLVAFEWRPG